MNNCYFNSVPNEVIAHIFSFVPYHKSNWKSISVSCARFMLIAERVFDPSLANNRAIRFASSEGQTTVRDLNCRI